MSQSSGKQRILLDKFVDQVNQCERERYGADRTRPSTAAQVEPYWQAGRTPQETVDALEEEFLDEARAESRMS